MGNVDCLMKILLLVAFAIYGAYADCKTDQCYNNVGTTNYYSGDDYCCEGLGNPMCRDSYVVTDRTWSLDSTLATSYCHGCSGSEACYGQYRCCDISLAAGIIWAIIIGSCCCCFIGGGLLVFFLIIKPKRARQPQAQPGTMQPATAVVINQAPDCCSDSLPAGWSAAHDPASGKCTSSPQHSARVAWHAIHIVEVVEACLRICRLCNFGCGAAGKEYYVNDVTKETSWDFPTEPATATHGSV